MRENRYEMRVLLLVSIATLAVTGVAHAGARATATGRPVVERGSMRCPIAARVEIAVTGEVDEVRAVSGASAPGAISAVTVVTGRSDRRVDVGAGTSTLQFDNPLPAGRWIVAIEPVLDAPATACVDHVQLFRRGTLVATIVPR